MQPLDIVFIISVVFVVSSGVSYLLKRSSLCMGLFALAAGTLAIGEILYNNHSYVSIAMHVTFALFFGVRAYKTRTVLGR